jgi:cytochrome c biogenesis protein CcmG, thiol:disulfide interchange protein DsbE
MTNSVLRQVRNLCAAAGFTAMLVGTACGGGGGTSGGTTPDGEKSGAASGKKAAELSATFVSGEGPKTLAEAKGKVVIVDFWATYCGPCKASFPKYQEMLDQFGGDLAVIAVSVDEPDDASEEKLKDFAKNTGVKFAILWDKEKKDASTYSPPKMPTSFIIDKDGNIAHTHAGYESGEEQKIADEVKKLIGK